MQRNLPNLDRLSVLSAAIMLAYISARWIHIPELRATLQLPGLYVETILNVNTLIAIAVGGLTASGTHWLLQGHPEIKNHRTLPHLLLPAMTAIVIGIPLGMLPQQLTWWGVFVIGTILLLLVLVAEYVVIDEYDEQYPFAAAGLIAISFALYLILAISLRAASLRLVFLLPIIALASGLVGTRSLHLRSRGAWMLSETIVIIIVLSQITAGLHFLPLSAFPFGLILVSTCYTLTVFLGNLVDGSQIRQAATGPLLIWLIIISFALWFR